MALAGVSESLGEGGLEKDLSPHLRPWGVESTEEPDAETSNGEPDLVTIYQESLPEMVGSYEKKATRKIAEKSLGAWEKPLMD
ncbi:Hypothetical protein NTJ_00250 [Nesidiocoris tenuis]|uniref:Uncharacterized protein n=1 Tax=Nesidiocoris tenuis TaxID=355587 RepID=A0ABN7A5Q0_9HEMI|nr:Hypothetical protein NTJ_00250 [Nesidiocoris tenuis]